MKFTVKEDLAIRFCQIIICILCTYFIFSTLLSCAMMAKKCAKYEKIIEIGVCNSKGECSISTSSGWIGTQKLPMEGLAVCVKYE